MFFHIALLVFGVFSLLGFLLSMATLYTLFRINRFPSDHLARMTAQSKVSLSRPFLVCAGDSNTQGCENVSYVDIMRSRLLQMPRPVQVINAGVNGDLAYNLRMRIDQIIALDPDYVSILIGSNDANAPLAPENSARYKRSKKLPQEPDLDFFIQNLSTLIQDLRSKTRARIALVSIPPIGEHRSSAPYATAQIYSTEIRRVALAQQLDYLPFFEQIDAALATPVNDSNPRQYEPGVTVFFQAAVQHYLLGQSWDCISQKNGLRFTVDTLHINSVAAQILSNLLENWIRSITSDS